MAILTANEKSLISFKETKILNLEIKKKDKKKTNYVKVKLLKHDMNMRFISVFIASKKIYIIVECGLKICTLIVS